MLAQRPCAAGKDGRKTKNRPEPVYLIGRGGGIRTRDPLHPMQVRYQAALRPDTSRHYSSGFWNCQRFRTNQSGTQIAQRCLDLCANLMHQSLVAVDLDLTLLLMDRRLTKPVARARDRETFLVEQLPNSPDQQHLVVLVVAPVSTALDRLQLGELLLPVTQHVRLDATQVADLADRELALRRDRGQILDVRIRAACLHR